MATKRVTVTGPDGKDQTITLDFEGSPTQEQISKAVNDHMERQLSPKAGDKTTKRVGLLKGTLPNEKWNKIENEGFLDSVYNNVKAPIDLVGKLTQEEEYPFQNLYETGRDLPKALYEGISDPVLKAMAGNFGGAAGDVAGMYGMKKLADLGSSPRNLVGTGRAIKAGAGELMTPATYRAIRGGAAAGGAVGAPFGGWQGAETGAGIGAGLGLATRVPDVLRAGQAGFQSAYSIPETWPGLIDQRFPAIPPESTMTGAQQLPAPGGAPRSQGAVVMPEQQTGFTMRSPIMGQAPVQNIGPAQIWGPSAGLNASTEAAFGFGQKQLPAPGVAPVSQGSYPLGGRISPVYGPPQGQVPLPINPASTEAAFQFPNKQLLAPTGDAPRTQGGYPMPGRVASTVAPPQGEVPIPVSPFNLLDRLRALRDFQVSEGGFGPNPEEAPVAQATRTVKAPKATQTGKMKPVKAPGVKQIGGKSELPKGEPTETTDATGTGERPTSAPTEVSKTEVSTTPESPKVLTISFVQGEASNLGLPYEEVVKHLKNEGYKIISNYDTPKYFGKSKTKISPNSAAGAPEK